MSTPTQNRSSASVNTLASSAGSVPSRCRSTTYGRQACVGTGVEEVLVAGPGGPVRGVGDLVGEQLAGGQIFDPARVKRSSPLVSAE